MGLQSYGRLLDLPSNIRLGWKWIEVANTLAYYKTTTITAVKGFIVQAPGSRKYFLKQNLKKKI